MDNIFCRREVSVKLLAYYTSRRQKIQTYFLSEDGNALTVFWH